jgi:serine/threonine protein kinase
MGSLGEGAQGNIFCVRELNGSSQQEYALKRLKKESRSDRFKAEIEALRKIKHTNVMPIIDYSSDVDAGEGYGWFFVMPKAEGGNLAKRVSLYKGNLDSTLDVSIQLAMALQATHNQSIFHRDVKPANIVFKNVGHELWLSDFGICHNIDSERITNVGDVMGPRGFTAPELETGSADVTAACDVYSLGKVIYYMISGGVVIPRELFDNDFNSLKDRGGRYALLQILLSKMISPLSARISTAGDVLKDLTMIKDWEKGATKSALSPSLLAAINTSQQKAIEKDRIQRENLAIEGDLSRQVQSVSASVIEWINGDLEEAKTLMNGSGQYELGIGEAAWDGRFRFGVKDYTEVSGTQLWFENRQDIFSSVISIKFFVCRLTKIVVAFGNDVKPRKAEEPKFALIPYLQEYTGPNRDTLGLGGFLQDIAVIETSHRELAQRTAQRYIQESHPIIARTFVGVPVNLMLEFRASEWPGITQVVRDLVSKSLELAINFAMSSTRVCGR